jgi:hypothetical protein
MWPAFVVLAIVDGVVGHRWPVVGRDESVLGGIVVALVLNLIGAAALSRPFGMVLRRHRADLPSDIARDYAGTGCIVLVTVGFVALGLLNHPSVVRAAQTMRDADIRAAAWIGDHAPDPFRANAARLDTVVIQAGRVYRSCVANPAGTRDFCVIVDESKPVDRSVVPDGSESNETLSRGVG